ncbi:MAG: hypothetical protein ALAOOOJD_00878 [bacterium]|nr:hypothetical protein [bacterium]
MIHWLIAIIITLASAYYQRTTGPTYPLKGSFLFDGQNQTFRLDRSHESDRDQPVTLLIPNPAVNGEVLWRRFPTQEAWQVLLMTRRGDTLQAALPKQPPAGKLEYVVILKNGATPIRLPVQGAVVTRFKGKVPNAFLVPHILFMFAAMLLSTRTGLEGLRPAGRLRIYTWTTTIALFVGGMIFGCIVQKYAFGAYWTGVPFGIDLTDNKTLIALVGWVAATIAVEKNRHAKFWIITAAILTLAVYAIPHSVLGSELKY